MILVLEAALLVGATVLFENSLCSLQWQVEILRPVSICRPKLKSLGYPWISLH